MKHPVLTFFKKTLLNLYCLSTYLRCQVPSTLIKRLTPVRTTRVNCPSHERYRNNFCCTLIIKLISVRAETGQK